VRSSIATIPIVGLVSASAKIKTVLAMRAKGFGYRKIAKEAGLVVGTVMRLTPATKQTSRPFDGATVAAM
jgi:hypothetical protein